MILKRLVPLVLGLSQTKKASVPLLSAVSQDPDLSEFSALINSTGGTTGKPGPGFEDAFNNPADGRRYTIFAPVNSAFADTSANISDTLKSPVAFPLLEALLRSHITEGKLDETIITNRGSAVAIEGFNITFNSSTFGAVKINGQANLISNSPMKAANGAIFSIDALLDPFITYFGHDSDTSPVPQSEASQPSCYGKKQNVTTMLDVLSKTPQLSNFTDYIKMLAPDFATMLNSLPKEPNNRNMTLFAPSNTAFGKLPQGALEKLVEPINQPLSAWLLKFHLVYTISPGNAISILGFPLKLVGTSGNITAVNNAMVDGRQICACNGCVFVVSRWLDPVYGLFGKTT